ncbi:MAG: BCAM0308 family protein [Rhodothermales bacterium]|nr:BCAM0308 family protein [Rhodothermales bacterium]
MERAKNDSRKKGTMGQRERFKDNRHDTYLERKKWLEPTACRTCGAVYTAGRWTWNPAPMSVHEVTCPACQRIADGYPAGMIALRGSFLPLHRDEVLGLIRNTEAAEKGEHPLERLMGVSEKGDQTDITTTGIHLARRIGSALASAYGGELKIEFGEGSNTIRVVWER